VRVLLLVLLPVLVLLSRLGERRAARAARGGATTAPRQVPRASERESAARELREVARTGPQCGARSSGARLGRSAASGDSSDSRAA
jgi:hypothetical protein